MITYETGGRWFILNLFKMQGSVFPKACVVSVPSGVATATFVYLLQEGFIGDHFLNEDSVMNNNAIWSGFSFLVGFLVVFRTSQAYSRFWEGASSMHKMGAEWFDASSSLVAYCKFSQEPDYVILRFQNTLVRLFSMLHAVALAEIEDAGNFASADDVEAFTMELIDAESIDPGSLRAIRDSGSRVELVFQWIQQYVVVNIQTKVLSVPPPILSRSFQEIATGMVHFHEAMKISNVPFPFPYAQTCDILLMMYWVFVPFVVAQWVHTFWWAAIFSFIQVFTLWTLNLIAVELENPFGTDANDIDGYRLQLDMNNHLRLLLFDDSRRIPTLSDAIPDMDFLPEQTSFSPAQMLQQERALLERATSKDESIRVASTFKEIWQSMDPKLSIAKRRCTINMKAMKQRRVARVAAALLRPMDVMHLEDKLVKPLAKIKTSLLGFGRSTDRSTEELHVDFSDGMPPSEEYEDPSDSFTKDPPCPPASSAAAACSRNGEPLGPESVQVNTDSPARPDSTEEIPAEPKDAIAMSFLGKWERVDSPRPVSIGSPPPLEELAPRVGEGLQLRLGQIFDHLDKDDGSYATGAWDEMYDGGTFRSIARPAPLAQPEPWDSSGDAKG